MKGNWQASKIGLQVNLGREATTRAAKRLIVLPPLWMARPSCAELLEMSSAAH